MSYQAIPADCGLIEWARSDVEVAGNLSLLHYWFSREKRRPAPGRESDEQGPLWAWCCRLAGERPELFARNCYLDRRWDKLHYLLSATRRDEPAETADHTIDRAFNAGELSAEHAIASQGGPVRYLSPAHVQEVAAVVRPMNHVSLAVHYEPKKMEAAGVYKFWAERADNDEWQWIAKSFDEFRTFFLAASHAGDVVIVAID